MLSDVVLEMRLDRREIETETTQVRVCETHLHGQTALRCANVGERLVVPPREFLGDGNGRTHADAGHGLEEAGKPVRISVQARKEVATLLGLVLRSPSFQRLRQATPEWIEPGVGHLQQSAHIGLLVAIEEEISSRGIGISSAAPLQHAERHQGIQEVARAAPAEAKAIAESLRR